MMGLVVPYESGSGNVVTGMLWNYNDAIARAEVHAVKIDVDSKNMGLGELMAIKAWVESLRDLSLKIFTKLPLKDTLPANFWGGQWDETLHEFAEHPGSLSQLNCLGGLGLGADDDQTQGYLFSGDVVRGGYTLAPAAKRTRGFWEGMLRNFSKLLTCAYRLGRAVNPLEAYQPLSPFEVKILEAHHSHWSANLAHSLKNLNFRDTRSANAIDSELEGDKSLALRFALNRSKPFMHVLPPVVVVGCGTRDFAKYGRVGLDSLDTTHFEHARAGSGVLELLLGTNSSSDAVQRILGTVDMFFQNARNLRQQAAAMTGGGVGDCTKIRKMRVALIEDTPEKRE